MKRKLLLVIAIMAMLSCLFVMSVSAATELKSQTTSAYGELSLFDSSVSVGRTNTKYGFTPYIDAEGTTYARIVVGDGTTFYTFPTAYALSNSSIYGEGTRSIYVLDLASLNSAVADETGKNPGWTYKNIYRIELPYNMTYLNGGSNQAFKEYASLIELYLQPNTTTKDSNKQMLLFWNCKNLEVIHNLDTFVFRDGTLGGAFQNDAKLTNLVIGVSPEVTKTDDSMFSGCTALKSVNFKEAFPNLKTVGKTCFYQCTNLVSLSSEIGAAALPNSVTTINEQAFYQCKAMKYLALSTSLTYVGAAAFRECTALEFIDFNDNQNDIEFYNYGHFMGCSNLKAVSLSDNITILNNRIFASCTSLKAVYLPANLEQMNTNGNGQGPFCYNSKMYFVQEPFEVRDENGFFLGDSFVMPSKPDVYIMPSKLARAGGNASSGTWFRECSSLNKTIVMPEAFTNSTVVQMFRETASSNNVKNIVYLGDMESIAWSERNHHINFIFANPNDKDISSITFSSFYNNLNSDCYFYFCSTGYKYTMAKADATAVAATKVENSYCHILNPDPKASTIVKPTCITAGYEQGSCFCGTEMDRKDLAATGVHIFTIDNCTVSVGCTADANCTEMSVANAEHALVHTLVYANGFDNAGVYNCYCTNKNCTKVVDSDEDGVADTEIFDEVTNAIVTFKGFSVPENAGYFGIDAGYSIDKDLLHMYETVNDEEVTIALFMVNSADAVSVGSILDGDLALVQNVKGFCVELVSLNYTNISIKVKGFQKNADLTGNYYTLNLVTAMAIKTREGVSYVQTNLIDDSADNIATVGELSFKTVNANRVYTNTQG